MKTTTKRKHLSSIANHVLGKCAKTLDTTVDNLVEEFESGWKPEITPAKPANSYSRKLVEFCSSKALTIICDNIVEKIEDGTFSRFTFDMMLAWEQPSSSDEMAHSETMGKEREDRKIPVREMEEQDDISLFYSDIMPLLVDNEPSIGEDSFVWLASLVPLLGDIVNGRFTYETLTAPTANRIHFPAYDKYLKEVDKCIKYLQKQPTPTGVELASDEFILHMEGTARTQRVVRHIGGSSWPGRLVLTNYALYFEASGVVSYEDALKVDLSKNVDHNVKRASTGPWGAPLFDKAIVYESPELSESLVLEFPEMTSSTRREHWLTLIKEVILLHKFLFRFNIDSQHAWEMHARTVLGIVRLHAAREMLRISPPAPTNFLIFSLFDELPKGDYVIEELANNLKLINTTQPCSASSILKSLKMSNPGISNIEVKEEKVEEILSTDQTESISSLETTITQVREEAKEIDIAQATVEGLKEEGIGDSFIVLVELLSPLKGVVPWFEEVLKWERPPTTVLVLATTLFIAYREWIGKTLAVCLLWGVGKMLSARHEKRREREKHDEIVVSTASDQTAVESIVSAQHGLKTVQAMVQTANISLLKIQSVLMSRAEKHADQVMMMMVGLAVLLAVIPFKFIIMGSIIHVFMMNSKLGKYMKNDRGNRRLKEWWNSIPVIPVRTVDKTL
ncbi:hypothetical protein MKW94_006277 [Papaver nudicaule]|uniref:Uncharacterized protein n=1 Tax=Papaver nudicaule TaxID=74823 RepID=A0AA41VBU0_PAPNU|nr:hypothetical protein [Papaver nudicaule]